LRSRRAKFRVVPRRRLSPVRYAKLLPVFYEHRTHEGLRPSVLLPTKLCATDRLLYMPKIIVRYQRGQPCVILKTYRAQGRS